LCFTFKSKFCLLLHRVLFLDPGYKHVLSPGLRMKQQWKDLLSWWSVLKSCDCWSILFRDIARWIQLCKVPISGTEGSLPASTMESAISTTDRARLPVRNVDQPDSNQSLFQHQRLFLINNRLQFWLPWMRNHHQKTNDYLYSTSLYLMRMLVF
jgi:hypothetical protein